MKWIRWAFLLPLLGCFPLPCQAGLQQQDEGIRKFIQAAATGDREGARKSLAIGSANTAGVSLIQTSIEVLGGKKVDDITRTSFQYNWTEDAETLTATYHVRTGNEGFYLYYSSQFLDQKPPSIDFSWGRAEANPWIVRAINYSCQHWGALLAAGFLAAAIAVGLLIWAIIHFVGQKPAPPRLPTA